MVAHLTHKKELALLNIRPGKKKSRSYSRKASPHKFERPTVFEATRVSRHIVHDGMTNK